RLVLIVLIVLANHSLAFYPDGGGVWSWFLQFPMGLRALGHNIFWLETVKSTGDRGRDGELVRDFFSRIAPFGLDKHCAVMAFENPEVQDIRAAQVYGRSTETI